MDRKIIPFRKPVGPAQAEQPADRAFLGAASEDEWVSATIPQAQPVQARAIY